MDKAQLTGLRQREKQRADAFLAEMSYEVSPDDRIS